MVIKQNANILHTAHVNRCRIVVEDFHSKPLLTGFLGAKTQIKCAIFFVVINSADVCPCCNEVPLQALVTRREFSA
nr:MAG TPA: hypothetical protein [Caudoviricetes sp.]